MAANNEAEVLLYGGLGESEWDDVTSKAFSQELNALNDKKRITVRINSYGGSVFTGLAIYSMLNRHKAKVTTIIDGVAASAASVVAMAGSRVIMPKNAMLMIHNPSMLAWGDQNEMLKAAETLESIRNALIPVYADKTKLSKEQIVEMLDAETWFTAEEALAQGFADEIEASRQVSASMNNNILCVNGIEFDLKDVKNKPIFNFITNKTNEMEEISTMEITKDKLMSECKAVYDEVFTAGVAAERVRMTALDALDDTDVQEVKALVNKARYETGQNANDIAMEIVKLQRDHAKKQQPLKDIMNDAKCLETLAGAEPGNENAKEIETKAKRESVATAMQNFAKKIVGGVK